MHREVDENLKAVRTKIPRFELSDDSVARMPRYCVIQGATV